MTKSDAPWKIGWDSAKANFVPGLVLQALALVLVLSYYLWPAFKTALDPILRWQQENGWRSAFISRAFFSGILPGVFLLSVPSIRPRRPYASILACVFWWGGMGIAVNFLYHCQALMFGTGHGVGTLALKAFFDQMFYTPFFAVPLNGTFGFWLGRDLSFSQTRAEWPRHWIRELVIPNLIPNWAIWWPAMIVIYALPEALQVHMSGIVGCFWTLMCFQIGLRVH